MSAIEVSNQGPDREAGPEQGPELAIVSETPSLIEKLNGWSIFDGTYKDPIGRDIKNDLEGIFGQDRVADRMAAIVSYACVLVRDMPTTREVEEGSVTLSTRHEHLDEYSAMSRFQIKTDSGTSNLDSSAPGELDLLSIILEAKKAKLEIEVNRRDAVVEFIAESAALSVQYEKPQSVVLRELTANLVDKPTSKDGLIFVPVLGVIAKMSNQRLMGSDNVLSNYAVDKASDTVRIMALRQQGRSSELPELPKYIRDRQRSNLRPIE